MKTLTIGLIFSLFFLLTFVHADESVSVETITSAGVTPDSFFYVVDTTMDEFALSLHVSAEGKAAKALEIGQERLLEFQAMLEAEKMDKAERAEEEHGKAMASAKTAIESIDQQNSSHELEVELTLGAAIHEQESQIQELKADSQGTVAVQQESTVASLFSALELQVASTQDALDEKKQDTKMDIEQEGGDADEIESGLSISLGLFDEEEDYNESSASVDSSSSVDVHLGGSDDEEESSAEAESSMGVSI